MRGLAATAVLAVLLVGPPLLLAVLAGNPLPEQLPTADQLGGLLARPADDTLLLAVLTAMAWLLWAAFTLAVLLEVTAHLRSRRTPHLPGLGALQLAAGKLVTSALLMLNTAPAAAIAAPGPPAAIATLSPTAATTPDDATPHTPMTSTATRPSQRPEAERYTVQPGDSLREIADQELGDGRRWSQIARLNPEHITDPSQITPGWRLRLPTDDQQAHRPPPTRHPPPTDRDADQGADRAADGPPPRVTSQPACPGAAPHQPDVLVTAPAAHQTPDTGTTSLTPLVAVFASGMVAGGVLTRLAQMRTRQRQHRRRGRRIRLPAQPRAQHTEKRLARQSDQRTGQLLRAALRALPAALAAEHLPAPNIVGVHLIDGRLELLLNEPMPSAPAPFEVIIGSRDMCWQLTDPAALLHRREGVHDDLDGNGGSSEPDKIDDVDDADDIDPLPGLISAGRTDGGGHLLINTETLGVIGCTGPHTLVQRVLSNAALEAACNPWAGWYDAILVGFPDLEPIEGRVHTCQDLHEAITLMQWRADRIRLHLERLGTGPAGTGDIRDLRLVGAADAADDGLALTLLISNRPASPAQTQQLLEAVDGTGGLAALLPAPDAPGNLELPARFTVLDSPDHRPDHGPGLQMRIDPLHLTVRPEPLTRDDFHDIAELFTAAADLDDITPAEPPYSSTPTSLVAGSAAEDNRRPHHGHRDGTGHQLSLQPRQSGGSGDADSPAASPDHDRVQQSAGSNQDAAATAPPGPPGPRGALQVNILGPLQVHGASGKLQPKQVELVLLLALHRPAGLRNEQLRTLLGPDPDHPKRPDGLRQAITRTRRALGEAADGATRIQHTGDGIYRLHDATVDWDQFQQLTEHATEPGADAAADLTRALKLVRGKPLEDCYHWWVDTPLLESIRAAIVDAAEQLSEHRLAQGAAAAAGHAARKGLMCDPTAEQLWRMVMRAEHAAGNAAGVHEAWSSCLRELATIDPDLEPHPDTVTLFAHFGGGNGGGAVTGSIRGYRG